MLKPRKSDCMSYFNIFQLVFCFTDFANASSAQSQHSQCFSWGLSDALTGTNPWTFCSLLDRFFRCWKPDPPLHQRKRHCLWLCMILWYFMSGLRMGGIIDTNQERSRPFPGYFNLCCLSYFGWIDFFFMSNSHFFWSMCVTWDPDDTKSSKTGVKPSMSGLFI